MNIRNAFLFFACISFTAMSCDTRDPDPSANNLSEFAKEFVSMHVGSPNAMTSDGDVAFNQLIQNALGVMMLWMVVWYVKDRGDKKISLFKFSAHHTALYLTGRG